MPACSSFLEVSPAQGHCDNLSQWFRKGLLMGWIIAILVIRVGNSRIGWRSCLAPATLRSVHRLDTDCSSMAPGLRSSTAS